MNAIVTPQTMPPIPGRPRRERRWVDGVPHYRCRDCGAWRPFDGFYVLRNAASRCGRSSVCKPCDHARRVSRRRQRRAAA